MSRIGREAIVIPQGVTLTVNGNKVTVSGPHGTLSRDFPKDFAIVVLDGKAHLKNNSKEESMDAEYGLYRQLLNNMVIGVEKSYVKRLTINGVGFKATQTGEDITLNIGFSHPVVLKAEPGIKLSCEKTTVIVTGADKEAVGLYASKVRAIKPVEPYHAYGIFYTTEVVRRKESKSAKATAKK